MKNAFIFGILTTFIMTLQVNAFEYGYAAKGFKYVKHLHSE